MKYVLFTTHYSLRPLRLVSPQRALGPVDILPKTSFPAKGALQAAPLFYGGAVASFSVTMDSAGAANTFDSALESNPASVLGSTVVNTYGTPTVAITTWITSSPSASSESSSDDATEQNAAIGGAVAGAAVVAALVGLYFYHRKQKNRDERKSFAMHSKQAGARGEIGTVVASPPTAGSGDVAIKLARMPTLPLGWTEHVDKKTGAVYYFNDTTGESRWDRPQ